MSEIESVSFREATASDHDFLADIMLMSLFWREEELAPSLQDYRKVAPLSVYGYITDYGRRLGDLGVIAESKGDRLGAAWARHINLRSPELSLFPDQHFELAIGVLPEARHRGIGRRMLQHLSEMASYYGESHIVLGVAVDNEWARGLYDQSGFKPRLDDSGKEVLIHLDCLPMIKELQPQESAPELVLCENA